MCELCILIATIIADGIIISLCIIEFSFLWKSRQRHNDRKLESIEIYLLSLCVSDFLCGTAMFVQDSIGLDSYLGLGDVNMTGEVEQLFDFFFIFFLISSYFHIMIIAMERLVAVALPTKYDTIDRGSFRKITLMTTWFVTAVSAGAMYGYSSHKIKVAKSRTERIETFMFIRTFYGGVLVSLCVAVFAAYFVLFLLIVKREAEIQELMQLPPGQRRSRRNTYLSLIIGSSFVVCVLPFSVCYFLPVCNPLVSLLLTLNHAVNPVVYFIKYYVDGRRRNRTMVEQQTCIPTASTSST